MSEVGQPAELGGVYFPRYTNLGIANYIDQLSDKTITLVECSPNYKH